jgi:hypothetical protein
MQKARVIVVDRAIQQKLSDFCGVFWVFLLG